MGVHHGKDSCPLFVCDVMHRMFILAVQSAIPNLCLIARTFVLRTPVSCEWQQKHEILH